MKKGIICAALLAAVICGAASCGGDNKPAESTTTTAAEQSSKADFTAADVTKAILDEIPINSAFEKKPDSLGDYFDSLDTGALTDSSYYICASGAYPDEIAAFRFDTADNAKDAVAAVKERLESQDKFFRDYTPEEAYKLDGAVIEQSGEWVVYLVTSDNSRAKEIALGFIG